MRLGLFCLSLASVFLLASCQKETQDQTSSINFKLEVQNAGTGIVQWTSGTANVTKLSVLNGQGQTLDSQAVSQQVDLLSSSALVIGAVSVPSGSYSNAWLGLALEPSGTTPGLSLQGTYNDGVSTIPVVLQITDAIQLKNLKDALTAASGSIYNADVVLDLTALLQNITATDLAAADRANGQVTISTTQNSALYTTILANLQAATTVTVQ